jgi:hypothetical protein
METTANVETVDIPRNVELEPLPFHAIAVNRFYWVRLRFPKEFLNIPSPEYPKSNCEGLSPAAWGALSLPPDHSQKGTNR